MKATAKVTDHMEVPSSIKPMVLDPLPEQPLVSILISNYNYGEYLGDAIESALQQTYDKLEVVICDDGSTDDSLRILERYRSLDRRIKVIYQANGGQSLALNAAFSESKGDIICLLDADDVFMPEKVRLIVKALAAAPDAGFAVNRMLLVDKAKKCLAEMPSLYDLPSGWNGPFLSSSGPRVLPGLPPTSGLSLRRSVAKAFFPLPAALKAYSDTLIQVVAPLMTPIVAIGGAPLSEYRVHGANIGGVSRFTENRLRNIVLYEREIWRVWRRCLSSAQSGVPSDSALPAEMPPSLMDYAYIRFGSDQDFNATYKAIPRASFEALPTPHRWYWRASTMLPGWLFRKSFDFVYGQTRAKMIARRILNSCRNSLWLQNNAINASREGLIERLGAKVPGAARTVYGEGQPENVPGFEVLGVQVHALQTEDVVARTEEWISNRSRCHTIAPTGMHGIVEAQHAPSFKETLNSMDAVVPDGMPLVWLGRRRGHHLPRRVYGPDLLLEFCDKTAGRGYRHFFYGGEPGVPERMAETLRRRFRGIEVCGTLSPPMRALDPEEDKEIVNMISRAAPDVLWVGLGTPKQERWMNEHRDQLHVPVMVSVGAAFDILSGRRKQAPRWMREHGLEWLFRLLQEPRRLWRRYLVYGAQFIVCLVVDSLRGKGLDLSEVSKQSVRD